MRRTLVLLLVLLSACGSVWASDTGRIAGRVVDADGNGAVGARVTVGTDGPSSTTGADGAFAIDGLAPGSYELNVSLRDERATLADVQVVAGQTADAEVTTAWRLGLADTVTVYAVSRSRERIVGAPSAVSTVSAEEIERRSANGQLPKLVEFTPGAEATQSGLFDFNLNVRGFNSSVNRRVLVLVDGRDPSIPVLGSQAWAAFAHPLYGVDNLEFVRGPASALYGADAFNGVLNMTTKAPRDHPGGMVQAVGGELATGRLDLAWSAPVGAGWYMKVVGGVYRSEDFAVSRVTETEYPGLANEVVPLATDEDEIEFVGLRFDRYFGQDENLLTLEAGTSNFSGIVGVTTAGRIQLLDSRNPWARANLNLAHWNFSASYTGRDVRDQLQLNTGTHSQLDSSRIDLDVQGNMTFADERGRLVGGAQYRRTEVDSADSSGRQTVLSQATEVDRTGLYAQVDYDFNSRIKGIAAARWDDSDLYDARVSPKAALVFGLTPAHSLRLTYNQAFQAPNLAEYFVEFPVAAPLDLSGIENALEPLLDGVPLGFEAVPFLAVGNRNLEVEEIATLELGYRGLIGRKFVVTADYYRSELDNFVSTLLPQLGTSLGRLNPDFGPYQPPAELSPVASAAVVGALEANLPPEVYAVMSNNPDGSPIFATFSFANIGRVDTQGVELGLNWFLGSRWRINAAYSWLDFEVQESAPESPILPNSPEHKIYAGASYVAPRWDASLQFRWFDDFDWRGGVFNGPVPTFNVFDFYANYTFNDHWKIGLNIANVFDNEHYEIFGGDILRRRALGQVTFSW